MSWQKFFVGDLVEAVKGDTVVRGRLVEPFECDNDFWVGESTKLLSGLQDCGFTVSLVSRARPELPTEPGLYSDSEGDAWLRDPGGKWTCLTFRGYTHDGLPLENDGLPLEDVESYSPFTCLESVADTAKKVLDAVSAEMDNVRWSTSTAAIGAVWDAVRNRFGVDNV